MSDHQVAMQLQALLDERDIIATALRYCTALDTKHWAALDDVFVPEATGILGRPGLLEGRDALKARIKSALDHLDLSQHLVGNHEVAVTGDTATHTCYLQAQHIRETTSGSPLYIVAGRYEDEFVRTTSGWRISHRTLNVMWTDGNLKVVRGD